MIWNLAAYQASTGVLHVQVCGTGDNIDPPPLHMVCCLTATAVQDGPVHSFTIRNLIAADYGAERERGDGRVAHIGRHSLGNR